MVSSSRGKICLLFLFLFLSVCLLTQRSQAHDCNSEAGKGEPTGLYLQHQAQIDRLEQLVKNLSEIVDKLESSHIRPLEVKKLGKSRDLNGKDDSDVFRRKGGETEDRSKEESKPKVSSVTKYSPFWSESFRFISAVNLNSVATSINVLPFQDFEGLSKYVGVGDDCGRVYVFSRFGDLATEFSTLSDASITVMYSYPSVYKNESILVTGHDNGAIAVHRIWESSSGADDSTSFHMEHMATLDSVQTGEIGSSITLLEVHHVGRSRYILSADADGRIKVFKENGALYGLAVPKSRPVAFVRQRLLFLTETGAGSLDLRTMKIKEVDCEGLNHSFVKNYVFDAVERSKAYGFTSSGDLIQVVLLGDIMNFKCRMRSWKKIELEEPVAFQAIKGYLLVVDKEKVYVYNVSSQHYGRSGSLRLTFSAGIEEIRSSFTNYQLNDAENLEKNPIPVMASDRENLVILGLGSGCVGMYHSKLPVTRGEPNTILWTSPVLFFILFLFGAWQFFAKKKEALIAWGPDDPFTSTTIASSGAPLGGGSTSGEASSFPDLTSRGSEAMDLRNNGLRGAPRRYGSPTQYPVGGAEFRPNSVGGADFRPNSVDSSSTRPSIDSNYQGNSELKYRGSNLEASGFAKRRENIYSNHQVLDDNH